MFSYVIDPLRVEFGPTPPAPPVPPFPVCITCLFVVLGISVPPPPVPPTFGIGKLLIVELFDPQIPPFPPLTENMSNVVAIPFPPLVVDVPAEPPVPTVIL